MNQDNKKRNRYAFFEFKGKYYGLDTIVKFKPGAVRSLYKENLLYGKYYYGCSYEDRNAFYIGNSQNTFGKCVVLVNNKEIYDIIEEIIIPVEVPYVSYSERKWAKNDFEDGELILWWIVYLFVMIGSCIFVWPLRFFLWAVASFVFWGCRYEKLKQYGYK